MRAYKFLSGGARAPLSGETWPVPTGGAPGEWVRAGEPGADSQLRVHGCTAAQLAHWLDDELWEVELDGDVAVEPFKVVAQRARLVARVDGYSPATARALAAACAWRAREIAVPQMGDASAELLSAPTTLAELSARAYELAATAGEPGRDLFVLVAEAAHEAEHARPATAILTATVALAGWDAAAQAVERAWQAEWLASTLGLAPDA